MFIAYKQNKHEDITYRHIYNINKDTLCIIRGAFFVLYIDYSLTMQSRISIP